MDSLNYDQAVEHYDATRSLPAESMTQLTDILAGLVDGRQPCLEIGVGTGRFALPLARRGISLVGMDLSDGMLRRLAANAGGVSPLPLVRADATRQPFGDAAFGSVLAAHVLHTIPDWHRAVDEALRVLRPGGALIVSFPNEGRAAVRTPPATVAAAAAVGRRRLHIGDDSSPAEVPKPANVPSPTDTAKPADVLSSMDALGLPRPAGAPWANAVREAAKRHGVSLAPHGAKDPGKVAEYLNGRASARQLEPVPVRVTTTLGTAIDYIRRRLYTWTWPSSAEQTTAMADDVLAWARRENMPLDTVHVAETAARWWIFEPYEA